MYFSWCTMGATWTCGKGIETGWADTHRAALSICKMSLTYQHKVLDDLFGAINWWKIKIMGEIKYFLNLLFLLL